MPEKIATGIAVLIPLIGLIIAVWGLWGWGFTWVELVLLVVMYFATGFGVTVGFHRLFTHRSFETFGVVKLVLTVLGSMSVQGSICHLWGRRPFRCNDESRNNFLCGLVALGEGWHNNHDAFPSSARHGLKWWEIDASFLVIRIMERLGIAWPVQVPSADAIARQRDV